MVLSITTAASTVRVVETRGNRDSYVVFLSLLKRFLRYLSLFGFFVACVNFAVSYGQGFSKTVLYRLIDFVEAGRHPWH